MGAFLMALAGPLARQVLISLGIGVVTFVGLDAAVQGAMSAAKASLGALTGDYLQIVALGGGFVAVSVIAGGITAGISMIALSRFTKI